LLPAARGSGSDACTAGLIALVAVTLPLAIVSAWSHYPD
jgi:hypothetical protein